MRALRGHNAQMVLIRLNPVIRGWSAYYRHCVSSKVFDALDDHVWKLTYKWANWTHPHKGKRWIVRRYFGRFVPSRRDRWVFGDRDSGAYLLKFAWTKITRHTLVKGWASPDDPALTSYWAARRRRGTPPLDPPRLRLLQQQRGRCPLCGQLLLHADQEPQHPDEWEQWIKAVRKATRHQAITVDARPGTARRTPPCSASSTPTADAASQTAPAVDQHFCSLTCTPSGLARAGCPESGHGRFRGGGGAAMRRRYPTGSRCSTCWRPQGSSACWPTPGRSRTCPAGPRPTGSTRCGWPGSPSAALIRPCFVPPPEIRRLRTTPATARDLIRRPAPRRSSGRRSCWKTRHQAVIRGHRHPRGDRPGHAGPPDRRGARPQGAGPAGPRPGCAARSPSWRRPWTAQFFTAGHAALLQMMLARIDRLTAEIAGSTEGIERAGRRTSSRSPSSTPSPARRDDRAQDLIAEIGVDMSRFPTAGHLVSWARLAPSVRESAGKRKARTPPAAATPTSAPPSARPPPEPGAPRPSSAPSTGG